MMTPESHFSGLDNASAEIKAAVDVAFQQMLTDIRSGMSARKAAFKAFSSFSGQFADVLRDGLSERMGAISMAEVRAYPVGGVSLSARLYAQARETSTVAQRLVQAEAKGWHDARRLALDLYEGYGFRENEALRTRKPLPKYLRDAVAEAGAAWEKLGSVELGGLIDDATVGPSLARELAKIQASALRTPALKAAYMQVLEGLEYGVGQDRLQKLLKTAWHERNRYFANRIAQTELHRAYSTARASEIMDDDEIQAVQIRMSSRHPRTDICDYFSKADLYGLGPGAYPKGKAPSPPFHPHCLPGDALITSCGRITAASKRWYDGDMVVVTTASGKRFTATINHPVLTRRGWVGAGLLDIGDDVVSSFDRVPVSWDGGFVHDKHQYVPSSIADIFDAFMRSGKVSPREVPVAAEDFHGDGVAGQIAIIGAYGELRDRVDEAAFQIGANHFFKPASASLSGLFCQGVFDFIFKRPLAPPNGVMGSVCKRRPLFWREPAHSQLVGFAPAANMDVTPGEQAKYRAALNAVFFRNGKTGQPVDIIRNNIVFHLCGDRPSLFHSHGAYFASGSQQDASDRELALDSLDAYAKLAGDILKGAAGQIFFDAVSDIKVFAWSGHVYNLETENGFYSCNDIITHNCRCTAHAVYATQKVRAHSRPGAAREFLRSMDASDAAKVMGSRDKLEAVLRGADPIAVWNGNADPLYRVQTVGNVANGGGLGIDGDMKTA